MAVDFLEYLAGDKSGRIEGALKEDKNKKLHFVTDFILRWLLVGCKASNKKYFVIDLQFSTTKFGIF